MLSLLVEVLQLKRSTKDHVHTRFYNILLVLGSLCYFLKVMLTTSPAFYLAGSAYAS